MSDLGKLAEDLAAEYYSKQGFKIIERNFFPRFGKRMGELDVICLKGKDLVFVEVKARRSDQFGSSFEAVDYFKQQKLVKTAKHYIQSHPEYADHHHRIDVAAVDIDNKQNPVIILTNAIEDLN